MQDLKEQDGKLYIKLTHEPFDTIQGEGKTQGVFTHLIRFAGCNLRCSFCDISENWTANFWYPYDELVTNAYGKNLLITGGEPMMTKERQQLIARIILDTHPSVEVGLPNSNYVPHRRICEVETNGTHYAIPELAYVVTHFNISPKEEHYQRRDLKSDINTKARLLEQIKVERWSPDKYIVKFVYTGRNDSWILTFVDLYQIPEQCVYIMPLGETKEQLDRMLPKAVDFAVRNRFNIAARLHIAVYGHIIKG